MQDYIKLVTSELGISIWLLVVIIIWSYFWKLLALWKSARKGSVAWFILLALINTVGILEILYIFVFSEMKFKKSKVKKSVKRQKRRKR